MKLNIKLKYEDQSILCVDFDDQETWIGDDDVLIAADQHTLGMYFSTSLREICIFASLGLKLAGRGELMLLQTHLNAFNKMLLGSAFSNRKII